jgi:hypothetical protein
MARGQHFEERRKNTADAQLSISTKKLREWGYLVPGYTSGTLTWSSISGEKRGALDAYVIITGREGSMRLVYTYTGTEEMDYGVDLVSTPCRLGGVRWWFICPLVRNGASCGRRVGVLYLVGKYAGCRHCYDLTYQSCQDSHKLDRVAAKMGIDPRELRRRINWLKRCAT